MAEACGFDEANTVLGRPPEMTHDECDPIEVMRGTIGDFVTVISCWKLTQEELDEVVRTKRVWLVVLGDTMQPAFVCGKKPNMEKSDEA